jgi:hypothetical protein
MVNKIRRLKKRPGPTRAVEPFKKKYFYSCTYMSSFITQFNFHFLHSPNDSPFLGATIIFSNIHYLYDLKVCTNITFLDIIHRIVFI